MKKFLLCSLNIERDSYVWNIVASTLQSFQSVIMLMLITRVTGLEEAGIFTIAYANANLFMIIGKYGMRYFQISDVNSQFTFAEYKCSRTITVSLMLVISLMITLYMAKTNHYTIEKIQVLIWMCLLKAVDAFEDVYIGLYQNKNRLDIAAKSVSVRMIVTIIIFGICIAIFKSLLLTLILTVFVTLWIFCVFTKWTYHQFYVSGEHVTPKNILLLFKLCFPLFAGSFLAFYIGNTPKYAIDSLLADELQACYGFISMPVFVIGVFSNFIFTPILYRLSILWSKGQIKSIVLQTVRQTGVVFIFAVICLIGAYFWGTPVLSAVYHADLSLYRTELIILLIGGVFLALSELLNKILTIARYQNIMLCGYGIVAVIAAFFSKYAVKEYQILGAAILYTSLMGMLFAMFASLTIYGLMKGAKKTNKTKEEIV